MARPRPKEAAEPRRPSAAASRPTAVPASAWTFVGLIAAVTVAVYARVGGFGFMNNYDDSLYVTGNPQVTSGLTWPNIAWAFTQPCAGNWHPLTMLSHMADCAAFGVTAGPAHLENLLIHVLNVLLLFRVLTLATGRTGPGLFAAGLFALHPMHVESVAWIAERKDVLSTMFALLTIWAYIRYTRSPKPFAYALVTIAFAAGLMSKPMLVTLPFVLLLLDVWPLGRLRVPGMTAKPARRAISWGRGLTEKLPLFALVLGSILLTLRAQRLSGALQGTTLLPLSMRVANALVATVAYVGKLFVPLPLAAIYPYPVTPPIAGATLAFAGLAAVTAVLFAIRGRAPYALFGWLWFLGTLVPVIGVIQVGSQSMADRYTYIPHIGLGIALAWGLADAARRWRWPSRAVTAAAVVVLAAFATMTWTQVGVWRDGTTLFGHAIRVTRGNFIAWSNYGVEALQTGHTDQAREAFESAVRINPHYETGLYNLGVVYKDQSRFEEAADCLRRALAVAPGNPHVELNLAIVLAARGRYADAMPHYEAAYRLVPHEPAVLFSYSNALSNYGVQQAQAGRKDEAVALLRRALEVNPGNADAKRNLELVAPGPH